MEIEDWLWDIVLEESDESAFWLEVLMEGGLAKETRGADKANQMSATFAQSSITASESLDRRR